MINTAGKIYLTLAILALGSAVGYYAGIGDHAGWVLLLFLMAAATLSGLAVAGAGVSDRARYVAEDAPIEQVALGESIAPRPSNWPIVAAAAVGILAVGLSVGADVVVIGVVGGMLAAGGWLGQVWREHPGWDAAKSQRLSERFLAPLGIPLGALAVVVFMVGSVSRVLLAVNEKASVAVAFFSAFLVLLIFALVAARPRISRTVTTAVVGVVAISLATAGVAGAAKGERPFEKREPGTHEVDITAKDTSYDTKVLSAPAKQHFHVRFANRDPGIYHNVGIYTQKTNQPVVDGQPIAGVAKITYDFIIDTPGTYDFRCDFHANMVGTLTVGP